MIIINKKTYVYTLTVRDVVHVTSFKNCTNERRQNAKWQNFTR